MKKIILKKFKKKYITKNYISWLNNKELMKFSEQRHLFHDYNTCLEYYNSFKKTNNVFFAIFDKQKNIHIGNITIIIDLFNQLAKISILIGYPNQGYGSATWKESIKYVKNNYNLRKITAGTVSANIAMIKIFKKNNMIYEYAKKKYDIENHKLIDFNFYCLYNYK